MLKYPDGTHVNSVSYAKMFLMSLCSVMIRVGRNEGEGAQLFAYEREISITRAYSCLACLLLSVYLYV